MTCYYPTCTSDTCTCVDSPEEIATYMSQKRREEATRVVGAFRGECERLETEYKVAGQPFGSDGLDTWLKLGGESGAN